MVVLRKRKEWGDGGAVTFLKSTTISTVFWVFSSGLLLLHQDTSRSTDWGLEVQQVLMDLVSGRQSSPAAHAASGPSGSQRSASRESPPG